MLIYLARQGYQDAREGDSLAMALTRVGGADGRMDLAVRAEGRGKLVDGFNDLLARHLAEVGGIAGVNAEQAQALAGLARQLDRLRGELDSQVQQFLVSRA